MREMAYCQVPAFQHDLEKIVEDVRNGIYPLTAFAPLAHQPLKPVVRDQLFSSSLLLKLTAIHPFVADFAAVHANDPAAHIHGGS